MQSKINSTPVKDQNFLKHMAHSHALQTFKVIMIGDAAVGKTQILVNFLDREYSPDYSSTIGVEFSSKVVQIDKQTILRLQIWDTAGQENFRSIIRTFYRNAQAVLVIYNIACEESFLNCRRWLNDALENSIENPVKVLVGAQCDREGERQVCKDRAQKFADEHNFDLFFETSSLVGENIDSMFVETALKMFNRQMLTNSTLGSTKNSFDSKYSVDSNVLTQAQYKRLSMTQPEKQEKKSSCC